MQLRVKHFKRLFQDGDTDEEKYNKIENKLKDHAFIRRLQNKFKRNDADIRHLVTIYVQFTKNKEETLKSLSRAIFWICLRSYYENQIYAQHADAIEEIKMADVARLPPKLLKIQCIGNVLLQRYGNVDKL